MAQAKEISSNKEDDWGSLLSSLSDIAIYHQAMQSLLDADLNDFHEFPKLQL